MRESFFISARKSAPNDGTGLFGTAPNIGYRRSKQNSDASGMKYQWGRKDPFTFATSSLHNGGADGYGKYPVKIYNGKRELIHQADNGGGNSGKTPTGGMIHQGDPASSMMETIKSPNIICGVSNNVTINQVGHSNELFNYYWTSYSRGIDGKDNRPYWHNTYLDGYIVLRPKSIYDPCPYGYRTPTNSTYNDFTIIPDFGNNYVSGLKITISWFPAQGRKSGLFQQVGNRFIYWYSTLALRNQAYNHVNYTSNRCNHGSTYGFSVRCIEDATVKADQSEKNMATSIKVAIQTN